MTPTLCPHCGGHKDRCRCAAIRREGMIMAALDLEWLVQRTSDEIGPLERGHQIAASIMLGCATRIRALANGAP